jgi:hypothetical protein
MGREEVSIGREEARSAPEAAALLGNVITPDRLGACRRSSEASLTQNLRVREWEN